MNKWAKDDNEDELEKNMSRLHPEKQTYRHQTSSKQCANVTPKIYDPTRNKKKNVERNSRPNRGKFGNEQN